MRNASEPVAWKLPRATALAVAILAATAVSCSGGSAGPGGDADAAQADAPLPEDVVQDVVPEAPPVEAIADTGPDPADEDDTAADESAADVPADETVAYPAVFTNPHDGRLYAAAGSATITPDAMNHPCTVYLGGTGWNRLSQGVHDDLELRALVLEQDGRHLVVVSIDVVGLVQPDADLVRARLAARQVDPDHVMVSSTHVHSGPDTMGIWGPDFQTTGRCPQYIAFLADTVEALVADLAAHMVPVTVAAGETSVNDPGSDFPALVRDFRDPFVIQNRMGVVAFRDDAGVMVATVVNWHVHPEVMIGSDRLSADFPHYLRPTVEAATGGTCVYLSGTLGGLQVPLDLAVPLYTQDGKPVMQDGVPAHTSANDEVKQWSLGYELASRAIEALANATPVEPALSVATTTVDLPLTNVYLYAAMVLEVVPHFDLVKDRPDTCGAYGCVRQTVPLASLGPLHALCLPGEVLPESSIGRDEVTIEWGGEWGPMTYPAMNGWRAALPQGHLLLELGLCNDEIGYVVPAADYQPPGHPNYYCEDNCMGPEAEGILREAVEDLLGAL
jgi:hypothetical protein